MDGTSVIVGSSIVGTIPLDGVEHHFKLPDHQHIVINIDEPLFSVFLELFLYLRFVLVNRNVLYSYNIRFSDRLGINIL